MNWPTRLAETSVDTLFRCLPRAPVSAAEWQDLRLVAHRGCVNPHQAIYENTLAAFETARQVGAWGIEFDVQWTLDQWPVVIHDPHTARLPGADAVAVNQTELDELRARCPLVPRLEEVIEQFAGDLHLMIELKGPPLGSRASTRLGACLDMLHPGENFHLMSLEPRALRELKGFSPAVKLLIATTNTRAMFAEFEQGGFGGLTGHFLLLNRRMRLHLESLGVPWGTGFINSMNLLAREVRSGTTWMFSDAAEALLSNAAVANA